jgi:hypothetical protein
VRLVRNDSSCLILWIRSRCQGVLGTSILPSLALPFRLQPSKKADQKWAEPKRCLSRSIKNHTDNVFTGFRGTISIIKVFQYEASVHAPWAESASILTSYGGIKNDGCRWRLDLPPREMNIVPEINAKVKSNPRNGLHPLHFV